MSPWGTRTLTKNISVVLSEPLFDGLNALCDKFAVQRGVVIRDALEFYLSMAKSEIEESGPLRGIDAVPIVMAPDKVRRPDGVVVSLYDANHIGARQG